MTILTRLSAHGITAGSAPAELLLALVEKKPRLVEDLRQAGFDRHTLAEALRELQGKAALAVVLAPVEGHQSTGERMSDA